MLVTPLSIYNMQRTFARHCCEDLTALGTCYIRSPQAALRSSVVENRACLKMRLPKMPGNAPASFSISGSFDLRDSIRSHPLSITTSSCIADYTALRARSILHLHPKQTQQSHQQARRHALPRLGHPSVSEGLRSAFQGVQDHLLRRARGRFCQWQWYVHLMQGLERLSKLTCTHSADCEALAHLFRAWNSRWGQVQHLSPLMDSPGSRWVTGPVWLG